MDDTIMNRAVDDTVDDVLRKDVFWAIHYTMNGDVREVVRRTVKRPVEFAVPLIFADAEHPAFDAEHPALQDFLRSGKL